MDRIYIMIVYLTIWKNPSTQSVECCTSWSLLQFPLNTLELEDFIPIVKSSSKSSKRSIVFVKMAEASDTGGSDLMKSC